MGPTLTRQDTKKKKKTINTIASARLDELEYLDRLDETEGDCTSEADGMFLTELV